MELPAGTVTFLFTDIGDSTLLWESHPGEMPEVSSAHDRLLGACVEDHAGIVVKSTGDGLMIVFGDATDAVAAAIDGQRAIGAEPWAVPIVVRMGLHTGPARPIDGDYHAPAVNRAARVAGAAHPGQILASTATATLAESFGYLDLGEHTLKGLPPMRLLQVVAPGLTREFPPLPDGGAVPSIPVALTSFVGRAVQIDAVADQVRHHTLVTLTGVGGCGKTRLAIEVATRVAAEFPDGVHFIELAPVVDGSGLAVAVTTALGLAEDAGVDPVRRLARYLADREVLLVLDNCEHLVDACAALVEGLAGSGRAIRVLATSREALDVAGERVISVRSLDIDAEAVPLFVDRASARRPGFEVDRVDEERIAEVCRRLDGMPLAIELAAAQAAHLSVAQILDLLDDRFRLLVGGRRRVQRQQTLSATLDWSHELLEEDDRAALRRLAVFPSTFSLEAADAVAGMDDTLRNLASLARKSLLDVIEDGDQFRYRLLETVRIYAQDRLMEAGEAGTCRDRHRDWVVGWMESTPLDVRWLGDDDLLQAERSNIRAALEWCAERGDGEDLARLASGVDWVRSDARSEGAEWCSLAASVEGLPRAVELQVLTNLAITKVTGLDPEGLIWAERAMQASGDEPSALRAVALAWSSAVLAVRALRTDDRVMARDAERCAERSITMSHREAAPWQMYCDFVAGMAIASLATSDPAAYVRAETHYASAAAGASADPRFRALKASLFEYHALFQLLGGRPEEALLIAREAPSKDGRWPMFGQNGSAVRVLALAATGAHRDARSALLEMHTNFRRNDAPFGDRTVCMYAGAIAAIENDWERAATLLGAGRDGIQAGAEAALVYVHHRDLTRSALGVSRSRALRDEGMALPLSAAIELSLGSLGER